MALACPLIDEVFSVERPDRTPHGHDALTLDVRMARNLSPAHRTIGVELKPSVDASNVEHVTAVRQMLQPVPFLELSQANRALGADARLRHLHFLLVESSGWQVVHREGVQAVAVELEGWVVWVGVVQELPP